MEPTNLSERVAHDDRAAALGRLVLLTLGMSVFMGGGCSGQEATQHHGASSDAGAADAGHGWGLQDGGAAGSGKLDYSGVDGSELPAPTPPELLTNGERENQNLASVGRFKWSMSCTAALVDVGGVDSSPAYVLTSGHCVVDAFSRTSGTAVHEGLAPDPRSAVTFNYFADVPEGERVVVPTKTAAYATMKGHDLAIVELDSTVGALKARGLKPLPLAVAPPVPGSRISWVGAPLNFPQGQAMLRQGQCNVRPRRQVIESRWSWYDLHSSDCSGARSGASGSPVLADGEVFAVVNTTTSDAVSQTCYADNPCEVSPTDTRMVPERTYAVDVTGLSACFLDGVFAPDTQGCGLDRGYGALSVTKRGANLTRPTDSTGEPVRWQVELAVADAAERETALVQFKTGLAATTDCRDLAGYSEPTPIAQQPLLALPVPQVEGIYVACLLGNVGGRPQARERPFVLPLSIDTTPPTLKPRLMVYRSCTFEPMFLPPELTGFRVATGAPGTLDCAHASLRPYIRIPIRVGVFPFQLCLVANDVAGNRSEPFDILVDAQYLRGDGPISCGE